MLIANISKIYRAARRGAKRHDGFSAVISDGEIPHGDNIHTDKQICAGQISASDFHGMEGVLVGQCYVDEIGRDVVCCSLGVKNLGESSLDKIQFGDNLFADHASGGTGIPDGLVSFEVWMWPGRAGIECLRNGNGNF